MVCLRLAGDGFGEKCLTRSWWAVEQDTLGWLHPVLDELLGVLDGVLRGLLQLLLNLVETTNILPLDGGYFDGSLAKSRGIRITEGKSGVLHCDTKRIKDFGVDSVCVEIVEVHFLGDLLHGSFGTQCVKIRTDATVSITCDLSDI